MEFKSVVYYLLKATQKGVPGLKLSFPPYLRLLYIILYINGFFICKYSDKQSVRGSAREVETLSSFAATDMLMLVCQ